MMSVAVKCWMESRVAVGRRVLRDILHASMQLWKERLLFDSETATRVSMMLHTIIKHATLTTLIDYLHITSVGRKSETHSHIPNCPSRTPGQSHLHAPI